MDQIGNKPIVSITRVKDDRVSFAVEDAIDLLGGMRAVTEGKTRIMLKPNLVANSPAVTTKPEVARKLAKLMQEAGKEVLIGEASAGATGVNVLDGEIYRTNNPELLDRMQQQIFDQLGYTELAHAMGIPLINLHTGEMVEVPVPDGFVFEKISLQRSLTEIDLLCSVPMMKTHTLATVTLGMKNLIGLYPGSVYSAVKAWVHDQANQAGSPGMAYEIIDMVKINPLGLVVVDGSMAMEGNGPTDGELVKMGVIVAGTNPLATDMVAAYLMGFEMEEIPTFACAHTAGMTPYNLEEIEIRGEQMEQVRRPFKKPEIHAWSSINQFWGVKVLE